MARNQEMTSVLVIVAILLGLLLAGSAGAMLMSGGMMGGGMMGGGTESGGLNYGWLAIILGLTVVFVAVIALLMSPRQDIVAINPPSLTRSYVPPSPVKAVASPAPELGAQRFSSNEEAAIFKLLNEDEKRLYALIRERGGEMLQKDIVANGSFSKAKVTRLLDKLESKEVVIRERHGMTNKISLRIMRPNSSEPS